MNDLENCTHCNKLFEKSEIELFHEKDVCVDCNVKLSNLEIVEKEISELMDNLEDFQDFYQLSDLKKTANKLHSEILEAQKYSYD